MVQTRSQAKTTTRTTTATTKTKTKTKTKTTESLPKRKATVSSFKAPSTGDDSEALAKSIPTAKAPKEMSTTKLTKAAAGKRGLEKVEAGSQSVVPAVATKSELLKSSLQEAPRRGRKKAANRKIEEKTGAETGPIVQESVRVEVFGKDGDDPHDVHQGIEEDNVGRRRGIKNAEDAGVIRKTAATRTRQQRPEKRDVPVTTPSAATTAPTTGRGRRAAKSQCDTDADAGSLRGRGNARLAPTNVSRTERRGKLKEKQAEAHVQLHEDKHATMSEKSQSGQKQPAPKKTLTKRAPVASKRQKLTAATIGTTKSTTKSTSKPVKASSGKAVSVAHMAPSASYIERTEHRDTQHPASPLLYSKSHQNPLKQNVDESPLKKPPRSPVKMLMAITPAKRSSDEFSEDEYDSNADDDSARNHIEKEWENMRNIQLSTIKHGPAKMMAVQETFTKYSSPGPNEKTIGKDLMETNGDETESEIEEEKKEEQKEINTGPTPLTFKPSSLRFLTSLTPMFQADSTNEAHPARYYSNSTSEKKCKTGNLEESNHQTGSLATAPQVYKSNKSLVSPSKLVGVATSLFRTPFSASVQPLTPFQPASPVAKAATCASAKVSSPTKTLDATSASARRSKDHKHAASTSVPTSLFKSIMRVPQSSSDLPRSSSTASLSSANAPEVTKLSPVLTPTSSPSPARISLRVDPAAPFTPSVRTPCRNGTVAGDEKTAKLTKSNAAVCLPRSQSRNAVPMTEPPVTRPILKSALKIPASSTASKSVAMNKIKKLAFLNEKKSNMIPEEKNKIVHGEIFDDRIGSIAGKGVEVTPARLNVSPAKTVTFESPNPLPETSATTQRRRQPMAPTAVEMFEHLEGMDTAEEIFERAGVEGEARESLAGSVSGQILSGAVFYVEVNSADGADAADIFIPLLTEMGATCVPGWLNSFDGITHVLFKDGQRKTLEKVAASGGKIKCVNIGWPLDCERYGKWMNEADYSVDLSQILKSPPKPSALSALNNNTSTPIGLRTPVALKSTKSVAAHLVPTPKFLLRTPTTTNASKSDKENIPTPDTDQSPTTPYFLHPDNLVQKTCPPKQIYRPLFGSQDGQLSFKEKLNGAKRKSMHCRPMLTASPVKRAPGLF